MLRNSKCVPKSEFQVQYVSIFHTQIKDVCAQGDINIDKEVKFVALLKQMIIWGMK